MTHAEVKAALRAGRPTPGITQEMFESCLMETIREDHPTAQVRTLVESRSSEPDYHTQMAEMLQE
jgi:hypothetical protein